MIVRAMIEWKSGHADNARTSMAKGGETVRTVFADNAWMKPKFPAQWFEWLYASLLRTEAKALLSGG